MRWHRLLLVASIAIGSAGAGLLARESRGTPAARAAFDKGEAAARAGKPGDAAAAFREAIAADPDFVDAHQRLIEVSQRQQLQDPQSTSLTLLKRQYEQWARQHSKRAVYQVALGLLATDTDQADVFYNRAVALDPSFARAYFLLAKSDDSRGDWDAQRKHLKAAVDNNPDEPRYLLRYAVAHVKSDPARFRELATQVVGRFPDSPSAAEALYNLADASSNPERRRYLDRLRANYPVDRFTYAASGMNMLYGDLAEPSDALALARDVARLLPAAALWKSRVAAQEAMARAQTLIGTRQFGEALGVLEKAQPPTGNHGTTWMLLKAEAAAGAGQRESAYQALLESAAAAPDARIDAALTRYAVDLAKTSRDVEADVWRTRDARSTPAATFVLPSLPDDAPVKLADFRGRVVLLAFWYPT